MSEGIRVKDPDVTKDVPLDWSDWLGSETISSSTWAVPAGLTKVAESNTSTVSTVRLAGGTDGVDYEIVNTITTSTGQTEDRAITIQVREEEATTGDSAERANAYTVLKSWVAPDIIPTLTATEMKQHLQRHKLASTWRASTPYVPGDVILPTIRTGHQYICLIGGTSGTTEPYTGNERWPTTPRAKFTDGTSDPWLTWQEYGPEPASIYNIRLAAYDCWNLKVQKATQLIDVDDLKMNQVFDHCMKMRDSFAPMVIV